MRSHNEGSAWYSELNENESGASERREDFQEWGDSG